MNPHLLYAQAIKGRFTGRGIGIIDTHPPGRGRASRGGARAGRRGAGGRRRGRPRLVRRYLTWMTTHEYGIDEREAKNNHGTCWVMQVAEFARLARQRRAHRRSAATRFKDVLVPNQIAADGSFPEELRRTKPYGYSLFNLDAMTTICQMLSTPGRQPVDVRDARTAAA